MSTAGLALLSLVVIVGAPVIATAIVRVLVGPSRRHAIMMGLGTLTGPSIGVALSKRDMDSRRESNLAHHLARKIVAYDKCEILRVTRDTLEYVDEQGIICAIDLHTCYENVQEELHGPGWIQVSAIGPPDPFYVGFRDGCGEPPCVTFEGDPKICFQFPGRKPPIVVPGETFRRVDPTDPFRLFYWRLREAGVHTLDMS